MTSIRSLPKIFALTLLAGLLSTGCADSGNETQDGPTLKELGIDDGASKGASTSKQVKANEPASLSLKTGAELKIPEGALAKDTTIGIKRPEDHAAGNLVKTLQDDYKIASAPYVLTPHGTKFKSDVELTLPVGKTNGRRMVVGFLDDEKDTSWEIHEAMPIVVGKTAAIKIAHFSVAVLLEVEEDGANLMDAGVGESDASAEDASAPDATELDASALDGTVPDATLPDATVPQRLLARFTECQFRRGAGSELQPSLFTARTARQQCELDCLFSSSCQGFRSEFCGEGPSFDLYDCVEACKGYTVVLCAGFQQPQIQARRCDDYAECDDGSDEANCPRFTCPIGGSVLATSVCDGHVDCEDGRDEAPTAPSNCSPDLTFACANGTQWLPLTWRCDDEPDCSDGSDETGCTFINCADGQGHYSAEERCDLSTDCIDGSDEPASCLQYQCLDEPVDGDAAIGI